MARELFTATGISIYRCTINGHGVTGQFSAQNPPSRIYGIFRVGTDPNYCPDIPISPMVYEYKDGSVWRAFYTYTPNKIYQGFVYSYVNVNETMTVWKDWRVRFGGFLANFTFEQEDCPQLVNVKSVPNGHPEPYPISTPTVTLYDDNGQPLEVQELNVSGAGVFHNLTKGRPYNMSAQKDGYEQIDASRVRFTACTAETITLLLKFIPEPPIEPPPEEKQNFSLDLYLKAWSANPNASELVSRASAILSTLPNPFNKVFGWSGVQVIDEATEPKLRINFWVEHNPITVASILLIITAVTALIVASGYVVVKWKLVENETLEEQNGTYDDRADLVQYLQSEGYTQEQIAELLALVGGGYTKDWTSYIIPAVGVAALAYIISSKPWK